MFDLDHLALLVSLAVMAAIASSMQTSTAWQPDLGALALAESIGRALF